MPTAWTAVLLLHTLTTCSLAGSATWWNLGLLSWKAGSRLDQAMILSAQPMCTSIAGLSPKQAAYCQQHYRLMPAVTQGARLGMQQCVRQFRMRKWNCSTPGNGFAFGAVADDGTRESSFAHAVSAAGVVHAVSRACKRAAQEAGRGAADELPQCGCSKALRPSSLNRDYIWGGCGDDILFGYSFAKNFIDAKEAEQNHPRFSPQLARTMVNLHNNEVGRRAVFRSAEIGCKCHGVSGSCSLRTCWQKLRSFQQVGELLLKMYDQAMKVQLSKRGTDLRSVKKRRRRRKKSGRGRGLGRRRPKKSELVFLAESPDFCESNGALGIAGTRHRQCEVGVSGPSNCLELCCRRGHTTKRVSVTRRCRCKFEWCCQVKCETCVEEKEVHVCN